MAMRRRLAAVIAEVTGSPFPMPCYASFLTPITSYLKEHQLVTMHPRFPDVMLDFEPKASEALRTVHGLAEAGREAEASRARRAGSKAAATRANIASAFARLER